MTSPPAPATPLLSVASRTRNELDFTIMEKSLDMRLVCRHKGHKGQAALGHYANKPSLMIFALASGDPISRLFTMGYHLFCSVLNVKAQGALPTMRKS